MRIPSLVFYRLIAFVLMWLLASCSADSTQHQPLNNTADAHADWPYHGRTRDEQRFSPLDQISTDNVSSLSLAWSVDLPGKRGQEATPIVIGGVMYTTSAWSHVLALEAASGKTLWHFDPKVPKSTGVKGCCDAVNRGVAVMDGRVFVGTLDGRLIALDADSGEPLWSTITVDQSQNYTITGAPRAYDGKVFIGNGGAEYGVRGYISAYDAKSGELIWRFYTVPGGPGDPTGVEPVESQTATWDGEWWRFGGGGTVWDSMVVDPETNTLFFGVGNGTPWNPNTRTGGKGDNLYLSSIVAVNAKSGEYRWHYQTTPQEAWDFTATQHLILADITIDGEQRKVIMQAPKNGFYYVLDRVSGELISGEPFVPVTWASHIDKETGRPVVNPDAQYWKHGKPALVSPSWMGGHNWHPMSFNPVTGYVYLPAQETAFPYLAEDEQTPSRLAVNLGVDTKAAAFPDDPAVIEAVKAATKGRLIAWDPVAQKEVWRVDYPGPWNGGVLSTAGGLVFQGSATGFFNAYSATSGKKLWEFPAQTGIVAPPVSYSVNGEQYITVSAGWGGIFPLMTGPLALDASGGDPINRSRLLTFKLGGTARLPELADTKRSMPDLSELVVSQEQATRGFAIYDRYCVNCHGGGAVGGGVIPDLRYSAILSNPELWQKVVIGGIFSDLGMIGFGKELNDDDAEAIRQFIISRNQFARTIGDVERTSR